MSTITDVARVAGVSVATVSRALRGLDRVSPATRAKVEQAARDLRYVASPTAMSLASGRTGVVGVVVPFLTRWFFATLISAVEKALRAQDHHVLLFDLEGERFDARLRLTQSMLWKRVDGVIVLNVPVDQRERELLELLSLPVVSVGTGIGSWPNVRIDDAAAMATATTHVLDLGHTEVAYVGTVSPRSAHPRTPAQRAEAFRATMQFRGLRCPPRWMVPCDWTAAAALGETAPLLAHKRRPTAVVAASDEMAFGVMAAARRAGLEVPRDLSVIGIDDHALSGVLDLTTVRQDVEEQGRRAAQILLAALLDGAQRPPCPEEQVLDCELVVRGSTAPPLQR
jgi:DNA-binding LacI/PurR family transcriptional regulator